MKSVSLMKVIRVFFSKILLTLLVAAIAILFVISVVSVLFS